MGRDSNLFRGPASVAAQPESNQLSEYTDTKPNARFNGGSILFSVSGPRRSGR
jgi:hypothetical protein